MDSFISQAFQQELTCSICLSYFTDPVTIHCGHSFCRHCLCLSWEGVKTPADCPTCRKTSQQTVFKTNTVLKNLVSRVRQASLCRSLSSEEHMCRTHKETKKIFCEEDKILLCLLCSKSQERETHKHASIESVAEDYRERLSSQMGNLWEEMHEIKRNLYEEDSLTDMWMNVMQLDDVRIWRLVNEPEYEDLQSERSNCLAAWRTQAFISGKHYWDLDVDDSWNWALGVCRDSGIRRKGTLVQSEDVFLLVYMKEHNHYILFTTAPVICQYIQKPQGRVGVFLGCENGSMSFLNVTNSSLIWSYPDYSFNFPVRPYMIRDKLRT